MAYLKFVCIEELTNISPSNTRLYHSLISFSKNSTVDSGVTSNRSNLFKRSCSTFSLVGAAASEHLYIVEDPSL